MGKYDVLARLEWLRAIILSYSKRGPRSIVSELAYEAMCLENEDMC